MQWTPSIGSRLVKPVFILHRLREVSEVTPTALTVSPVSHTVHVGAVLGGLVLSLCEEGSPQGDCLGEGESFSSLS